MIRATAGTWANYATTFAFQILFASHFGTNPDASAFVIAFAIAVSASGLFITTALSIVVPRMLTRGGALSRRAVIGLAACLLGAAVVAIAVAWLGAAGPAAAISVVFPDGAGQPRAFLVLAAGLLVLLAASGIFSAVALARGHRFFPAMAPAFPSTAGAAYLLLNPEPTAAATLGAVTIGAAVQCLVAAALALVPRPRVVETPYLGMRSLAMWMFMVLLALNLLTPLQRVIAAAFEAPGAAQFDYAYRGLGVLQQLTIGGLALASLADWSQHPGARRLREGVSRATAAAGLGLVVAGGLVAVAAHPLVAMVLQRGAFTAADTDAVSTLLVILVPGFVAEGVAIVLTQALLAARFTGAYIQINSIRFGLHIVLILLLGSTFGAVGVAIGYVVALVATFAMTAVAAIRIGLLRDQANLLARTAGASGVVAATAIVLGALLRDFAIAAAVGVVVVAAICFVAFRLAELLPPGWQRLGSAEGGA
jgi:putative peptidoglycan lipid II flippase